MSPIRRKHSGRWATAHQLRRKHSGRWLAAHHWTSKLTVSEQEALEQVLQIEEGSGSVQSGDIQSKMHIPRLGQVLTELESFGLIIRSRGNIILTKKGRGEAVKLIRKNRLAEVLFTQVFDIPYTEAVDIACGFEHLALSDSITDSICTFLGHPQLSPEGKPIPPGDCCREQRSDLTPIVKRLTELCAGEDGRVVFVAPVSHSLLDRLSSLGIVPGEVIHIHQTKPTFVAQFAGTMMALEEEAAEKIYVRVGS